MDVSFGGWVSDRRKALGLTQAELADRSGISRVYVSLIETNGAQNLTIRMAKRLAGGLGVQWPDLFHRYVEQMDERQAADKPPTGR